MVVQIIQSRNEIEIGSGFIVGSLGELNGNLPYLLLHCLKGIKSGHSLLEDGPAFIMLHNLRQIPYGNVLGLVDSP